MENTSQPLPGTAFARADGKHIFLTKKIRLDRDDIRSVQPDPSGEGSIVITSKALSHVCEDYGAIVHFLYGVDVGKSGAHAGEAAL